MTQSNDRALHDDSELVDNYNFTSGIRGRFYKPKKVPTTMRLDDDILLFLKKEASKKRIAY